jgi:hypothetical protein
LMFLTHQMHSRHSYPIHTYLPSSKTWLPICKITLQILLVPLHKEVATSNFFQRLWKKQSTQLCPQIAISFPLEVDVTFLELPNVQTCEAYFVV